MNDRCWTSHIRDVSSPLTRCFTVCVCVRCWEWMIVVGKHVTWAVAVDVQYVSATDTVTVLPTRRIVHTASAWRLVWNNQFLCLLHFVWGVVEAKCILATAVCVSVPRHIPTLLHGLGLTLLCSCALVGGLAIGARLSLLWQHTQQMHIVRNVKC